MTDLQWNEKMLGNKNGINGVKWPEVDVFGQPYSRPASTLDVGSSGGFVVLPGREIQPEEWEAISKLTENAPQPVPMAEPETPNNSESDRPAWADQSVILPPPETEPTPVELAAPDQYSRVDPEILATADKPAPDAGNVTERKSKFK